MAAAAGHGAWALCETGQSRARESPEGGEVAVVLREDIAEVLRAIDEKKEEEEKKKEAERKKEAKKREAEQAAEKKEEEEKKRNANPQEQAHDEAPDPEWQFLLEKMRRFADRQS